MNTIKELLYNVGFLRLVYWCLILITLALIIYANTLIKKSKKALRQSESRLDNALKYEAKALENFSKINQVLIKQNELQKDSMSGLPERN